MTSWTIGGRTRLIGVMADPVTQARAPLSENQIRRTHLVYLDLLAPTATRAGVFPFSPRTGIRRIA